jgi:hypothetical protein
MGDVINLNKQRKARERAQARTKAAENRSRFGRSRAERDAEEKAATRATQDLDGKKLDD